MKTRSVLYLLNFVSIAAVHLSGQSVISESGGKVGIGTPIPNTKLHVLLNSGGPVARFESTINNDGQSYVYNTTANTISIWGVYDYAGNRFSYIGTESAHPFGFITSNVERMRITESGNVGIGTITPTSFGAGATLTEIHGTTSYGALLVSTNNVTGELFASEGGEVYMGSRSAHPLQLATGNVPRLTISMSGDVGIGTTGPAALLDAVSRDNSPLTTVATFEANNRTSAIQLGYNRITQVNSNPASAYLRLGVSNFPDSVFINSSGSVGIGTTNPTQKLSVNGTIRAKEVVVETTGWSDYVFADNYVLPPLAEVEAQIKQDKHLPGIPSAQQVAESGIGLGEMQAKLLAKIEELTLHQIEQEKRIHALEAENAKLRK